VTGIQMNFEGQERNRAIGLYAIARPAAVWTLLTLLAAIGTCYRATRPRAPALGAPATAT
jgi:hypothetical protein